jgi:hypothetical protein
MSGGDGDDVKTPAPPGPEAVSTRAAVDPARLLPYAMPVCKGPITSRLG